MKIITLSLPPIMTNCYIAYEKDGGKCYIIDPASEADSIILEIKKHSLKPIAILLTHGHFDHIAAADELRNEFKIPLYIHSDDAEMLTCATLNCSAMMLGEAITLMPADAYFSDGDYLPLEEEGLRVYHTPGHSKGSCVFVADDLIFSGDTIFYNTYGRFDLPSGDYYELMNSIKKILTLAPDLTVYPGHDRPTSIKNEIKNYN